MLNPSSHHQDCSKSSVTGQTSRWRDLLWAVLLAITVLLGLAAGPVEAHPCAQGEETGQRLG
jgi:hypothetical protein